MKAKHLITFAVLMGWLTLLWGCGTTPDSVITAGQMSGVASTVVEGNVEEVLDGYTVELKRLVARQYGAEFLVTERALLDVSQGRGNESGTVDLETYKRYAAMYAEEIRKGEDHYDMMRERFGLQLGIQFATQRNLQDAVQLFNESTGIPQETFERLVDGGVGLTHSILDSHQQKKALDAANKDPNTPSFDDLTKVLGEKLFTYAEDQVGAFDPATTFDRLRGQLEAYGTTTPSSPITADPLE